MNNKQKDDIFNTLGNPNANRLDPPPRWEWHTRKDNIVGYAAWVVLTLVIALVVFWHDLFG
jgi:hypothetical protein